MARWIDANSYLNYYALPSGAMAYHTGADLNLNTPAWDADKGKPVHSIANGIVTHARLIPTGTWGRLIVVRHIKPDGTTVHSRYAHLETMAVTEGQIVSRGDVLGTVGGAEWGMPNHLHFDISTSGILEKEPTHWPGKNKAAVERHYENPKAWLVAHNPPAGIDLLPYFHVKDAPIYQMTVLWQGQQHSQQMQVQGDATHFYQVKNSQWEEFYADANHIYRGIDTSPGDNLYYWQRQTESGAYARWCPRRWSVGSIYERNPLVTFYEKNTGRQVEEPASGYRRTWLKFVAQHKKWKAKQGIEFSDVIELHWLPNLSGAPAEVYFYARGFGLVGWSSSNGDYSFVSEVFRPGERTPAERERIAMPRN